MTVAEFVNKVGFKVNESDVKKVNNTMSDLKSTAASLLGAIGITLSVKGIYEAIKNCVALSSEVEEMENKFNVVFGGITDTVDKWAEDYADAIGRNKNDIKTYLADQQNLLVGFGMTREAGAELSEQMTSLALDLASFSNIDEATAVEAMSKAVMGEAESAKRIGAVLSDVTREQAMLALGMNGTYESLDQLSKMQVNYQAILMQNPDAIGDCERSLGSYQSTLKQFQSKLKEVKTLIGQFFMPTGQKILRFGANALIGLRNIVTKIQAFADKVGGSTKLLALLGATLTPILIALALPTLQKIATGIKGIGSALGAVSGKVLIIAAVVLVLFLLIDDFINFMKGNDSVIGGLLEKAGIDSEAVREKIIAAWAKIKDFLLKAWEAIKQVAVTVWGGIKTFLTAAWEVIKQVAETVWGGLQKFWEKHGEQIKTAFTNIWTGIKNVLTVAWAIIKTVAVTVFNFLKAFWDTWGSTIITAFTGIWNVIKAVFSAVFDVLADIFAVFSAIFAGDWAAAWENIKALFSDLWNGLVSIVSTVMTAIWNVISSIFTVIWGFISGIATSIWETVSTAFTNMWTSITDTVTGIYNSIVEGFQAAIDWITGLPAQALQWGADIINGIIDGIKGAVAGIGEAVGNVASTIKSFLGFSEPDEGPLSDFHTYMPDMVDLMSKGIKGGRDKIKNALQGLTGEMSVMAKANLVSGGTASAVSGGNSVSKKVVQNVNINNKFEGDKAGQRKSAAAMEKASGDATSEMARGLAYAL